MKNIVRKMTAALTMIVMLGSFVVVDATPALAADLFTEASVMVDRTAPYETGVINLSTYENINLSFDYDAELLDNNDELVYGWRSGAVDTDIAQIDGANEGGSGSPADEIGSVSVAIPAAAGLSDFEVYLKVDSNSDDDVVAVTNLVVSGDMVVVPPTPTAVKNVADNLFFDTLQEAIDVATTDPGETLELQEDLTTTEQTTITKSVIIDGNGKTLSADFEWISNSNNAALGVQADNVTITDITLDGVGDAAWPKQLHGVNAYQVTGLVLDTVTAQNFEGSGILINGSVATARDITTENNGWHGINVDKAGAALSIENTSAHNESLHIYIDDIAAGAVVTDVDSQYDYQDIDNLNDVAKSVANPRTARLYTLKTPAPDPHPHPINTDQTPFGKGDRIILCHMGAQGVNPHAVEVSWNSIINGNAHSGASHNDDIIPAFYYQANPSAAVELYAGRNWDAAGYDAWLDCKNGGVTVEPDGFISQCINPDANLLSNASFEDPIATANSAGGGKWEIFASIPSWLATNGVELWNNMFQGPSDGVQNVELDPAQSTTITQDVVTTPGAVYELRFDFAGREGRDASDNHIVAAANGMTLVDESTADTEWVTYGNTFTATSSTTTISFADAGVSNSFGTLLDKAVLCVVEEPDPEPQVATVTICKYDQDQNPLADWQLALIGDELDTHAFTVGGTAQEFSAVPAGAYVLKADGAYEYRGNTGLLADARFSERKAGDAGYGNYPYQPWRITNPATGGLAVSVDGDNGALWGSMFSPMHVYYGGITHAATGDIALTMYDDNYGDNVGTIDLTLFEGYAGATGNDGCVTFTDVPFGDYNIDEVLPPEWEPVSGLGDVVVDKATETFTVVNRDLTVPVDTCEIGFTVEFGSDTTVGGYETSGTTAGAFTIREITGGYEVALRENANNDDRVAADGMIVFANADLSGAVITKSTGHNKLENGSGNTELDEAVIVGNNVAFNLQVTTANDVFTITGIEKDCDAPETPDMCRLPFTVTYGEDSDETSYSTVEDTDGFVISEVAGGYKIALNDDGRGGVYEVMGTITFPAGTDLSGLTLTEGSGSNGLEPTHVLYPDIFDVSGNTITFHFNVNGANDEITITGIGLYGDDCTEPEPDPEPEMCYLGYEIVFDAESDINTQIVDGDIASSTAAGTFIVDQSNGKMVIAFMHKADNSLMRAKGTITFPAGTDLSGVTASDLPPYDDLEFGGGFTYPDTFIISGNTIVFDLYVTTGDDVQVLEGAVLYNEENCEDGDGDGGDGDTGGGSSSGGGGLVVYGSGGSSDDDDTPSGRVAGDSTSITLQDVIDELRRRLQDEFGVGGSQVSVIPVGAPNAGAGGAAPGAIPSPYAAPAAMMITRRNG